LVAVCLLGSSVARAQPEASGWRRFKIADGLPEAACTSVTISPRGQVLVTHLNTSAITRLTGYGVEAIPGPDTGQPRHRVYEGSSGQLWTATAAGLLEWRSGAWILYTNIPQLNLLSQSNLARPFDPVPLLPVRQGHVLVLFPDHLAAFDCEDPNRSQLRRVRDAEAGGIGRFSSFNPARDGGLWVAGERGLAKAPAPLKSLRPETEWREYSPPAALELHHFQNPHEDRNGDVTVLAETGTAHQHVLVHFDGWEWTSEPVGGEKTRFAWRGFDGGVWAMTANNLLLRDDPAADLVESEEGAARAYYDMAMEASGVFWLATSDGLFRYAPPAWRSPRSLPRPEVPISALAGDSEGALWFAAGTRLQTLSGARHKEFTLPRQGGRRAAPVRALSCLRNGDVLLEVDGQLIRFSPGGGVFADLPPREPGERYRLLGALGEGRVCWQRAAVDPARPVRLEIFDGEKMEPVPEGLPAGCGPRFSSVFHSQGGDLWISGEQGTAWLHAGKWRVFTSTDRSTPAGAVAFAEAPDGRLWCVTGDALWDFDGRTWQILRSGFDRITCLARGRDGSLWVGANNGLQRFVPAPSAWLENGREEGLSSPAVRALIEDQAGRLWAATTRGLDFFDPSLDRDPPQTVIRIHELTDTGHRIPEGGTITFRFAGRDKWNYTPYPRLLYAYQLDDHEWMPFTEKDGVSFTDQPAGVHILRVRAMDRCGNAEPRPATYEFEVILPWYRESRLVTISAGGLAVALFFAGLAFNRHVRLLRSYAEVEKKVADRTRELELANRELLHSQKMTALGTLAAGVAHDFNNILSIIQGSAQIIEDNLHDEVKVRTRLQRIKTVVEQGGSTVKAMLGFSRDSGPRPEPCQVNGMVRDTVKLLGDRFVREVQVELDLAPDLPEVVVAKDLVQQILLNFLFNAAEAMTGRRLVTISSRRWEPLSEALVLAPAKASGYAAIAVRDAGCGIAPEIIGRIFEPFFTTKAMSVRRGTGLGLSMVYEFAKKTGAGLAVESVMGQGSTFTVILPLGPPGASAAP